VADIVKLMAKTAHIVLLDGAQDPSATPAESWRPTTPADHEHFMNAVVVYEGLHTYGGMAGRTMEVLARGIAEMCDEAEVQWVMHQDRAVHRSPARGRASRWSAAATAPI